ncbi:MAG: GNAT family N-acetyltransferase [Reinekea sp.]|nr:GNAT family N-acetyltransferase [Reinekea sp.]
MVPYFKPINLNRNFGICQQMRAISYQASYGSLDGFERDYGDSYRVRLQQKIDNLPQGCCHLWLGDKVVGQTEAKWIADSTVGYINLLVVSPDYQRQGFGSLMVDYLADVFIAAGKTSMQLSVSPTNRQALAFYAANGWQDAGQRPNSSMRLYTRSLSKRR